MSLAGRRRLTPAQAVHALVQGVTYNTPDWDHAPLMRTIGVIAAQDLTLKEIEAALPNHLHRNENYDLDYFEGVCMKVCIFPDGDCSTRGYNINHGEGRAEHALRIYKLKEMVEK